MSEDLYILPPSLKPCEPVDGSDTRYLNQTHAPIVNLLQKPLSIELYNEKWFSNPPNTSSPPFLYDHATLSFPPADTSPFPTLLNFMRIRILLHQLLFSKILLALMILLSRLLLYTKHFRTLMGYFLSNILLRIHLSLDGFSYK